MSDRMLTGAQILCEALIREGVEVMFGIPGGTVMPFYHAMFEYRDRLRHVLCRHEQGAGHAAEGYARSTGKIGVCIGTSGPGATNLVTPIADAWMDSTPILAITGQVLHPLIGTDAFQETDITGITLPITKHNYLVTKPEDIPRVIQEAVYIATTGRTGPVHVDITKDCQQARCVPNWDTQINIRGYRVHNECDIDLIDRAVEVLSTASRPLIMVGNGVIQGEATQELRAFAELSSIPVITTLHGLGAFPEDHPLSLGMPGMHGWVHVNRAIQACDALLTIGARFDDRVTGKVSTFAPHARVIHVDVDKSELNKLVKAEVAIHAHARTALTALLERWRARHESSNTERVSTVQDRAGWLQEIRSLQAQYQPRQAYCRRDDTFALMPHDVYDALNASLRQRREQMGGGYRVITDVGQHQMWAAQLIDWALPRTHITSGGAGTMGFAVPAAMGVALAHPDDTVWVICGDGGFQMTNQELATMKQENIRNVKIAIINNGYLGMVRQWQQLFENKRYSNTPLSGPDFSQLAQAYGALGIRVDRADEVQSAIDAAFEHDGVVVIDFRVEQEVNVFPMVPQGKSIGEMLTSESEVEVAPV
jgi:acetolactate synthase-1/2/3 large subunit